MKKRKYGKVRVALVCASIFLGVSLFSLGNSPKVLAFGGGNGSQSSPYQITNCTDLQNVQNDLSSYYVLSNDIDCSATSTWNAGAGFLPIGQNGSGFTGNFNGNGHTISNLTIYNTTGTYTGLFSEIDYPGSISNVNISSANVTGEALTAIAAGTLVGSSGNIVTMNNVNVSGTISSVNGPNVDISGLVGSLRYGSVENSSANITLSAGASGDVGGVAGYTNYSYISGDSVEGSISSTPSMFTDDTAGIVGANNNTSISNTASNVNITTSGGTIVGGIVGNDYYGTISQTYYSGNIEGNNDVGGITGSAYESNYDQVYSTGNITLDGTNIATSGGLIGNSDKTNLTNSYSLMDISGTGGIASFDIGGLVGDIAYDTITDSYYDGTINVSDIDNVGGIGGEIDSDVTAIGDIALGNVTNTGGNNTGSFAGYYNVGNDVGYALDSFYDSQGGTLPCVGFTSDQCVNGKITDVNPSGNNSTYFYKTDSIEPFLGAVTGTTPWNFNSIWALTTGLPVLRFHPSSTIYNPTVSKSSNNAQAAMPTSPSTGYGEPLGTQTYIEFSIFTSLLIIGTGVYLKTSRN